MYDNGPVGEFVTQPGTRNTDYTVTIDWGDGTTSAATINEVSDGDYEVRGSHTYADEGSFTGSLTVHDNVNDLTQSAPLNFIATEADALAGTGVDFARRLGIPFSGTLATFTDTYTANVAGDFTATIDWGDGETSAGTVAGSSGNFAVSGSHTYVSAGVFQVTTTLSDDAPGTASATARGQATIGTSIPTLGWPALSVLGAAIALAALVLLRRLG